MDAVVTVLSVCLSAGLSPCVSDKLTTRRLMLYVFVSSVNRRLIPVCLPVEPSFRLYLPAMKTLGITSNIKQSFF